MKALVVTNPFKGYQVGSQITAPKEIEEILTSDHAGHVVATDLPDPKSQAAKSE